MDTLCIRKFCLQTFSLCKLLPAGEVGTTNSGKSANNPGETERFASLFYLFYSSLQTKSLTGSVARQDVIIGCVELESEPRAQWQHGLIRISSLFSAAPWLLAPAPQCKN